MYDNTFSRASCVLLDLVFSRLYNISTAAFASDMMFATASGRIPSGLVSVAAAFVEARVASVLES